MILCCGEALIDFVPLPGQRAYQPCPGGSIFNIAVGLGRLEVPVGFYCKMSSDFFGDMLLDYLGVNGVDTGLCPKTPAPTMLAIVSLDSGENEEPRYSFYAIGSAASNLMVSELPEKLPEGIDALHFGSLSLVLEPGASALESLMVRERNEKVNSLDPNIRPNMIPDRRVYRQRFESWLPSVNILKLSQVDRSWIYPDLDFDESLQDWFSLGVDLVIQTRGEKGAEAYTIKGEKASVKTPKVEVADTVGAGDAFLAAVLTFLFEKDLLKKDRLPRLNENQLTECLRFASKAAAINCSRVGADPAYRREV
jgi:fructokinase